MLSPELLDDEMPVSNSASEHSFKPRPRFLEHTGRSSEKSDTPKPGLIQNADDTPGPQTPRPRIKAVFFRRLPAHGN